MSSEYVRDLKSSSAEELAGKSLAERESALWVASNLYMRGKITLDELQEIETPYVDLEIQQSVGSIGRESSESDQGTSFLGRLFGKK